MKGKYITTLQNNEVPEDLRNLKTFTDVFVDNDGNEFPVIIEHSTEYNDDGEFVVYEDVPVLQ